MAEGVNKVILLGNLGQDPELRYTGSGQAVCNMRIATTERWTGRDGQAGERTEWHTIVVWGKRGETCGQYLRKGSQIYVEGRLQTRSWEDREGNKRRTTEVVANRVLFLSRMAGGPAERTDEPPPPDDTDLPPDLGDDDIPF